MDSLRKLDRKAKSYLQLMFSRSHSTRLASERRQMAEGGKRPLSVTPFVSVLFEPNAGDGHLQ